MKPTNPRESDFEKPAGELVDEDPPLVMVIGADEILRPLFPDRVDGCWHGEKGHPCALPEVEKLKDENAMLRRLSDTLSEKLDETHTHRCFTCERTVTKRTAERQGLDRLAEQARSLGLKLVPEVE